MQFREYTCRLMMTKNMTSALRFLRMVSTRSERDAFSALSFLSTNMLMVTATKMIKLQTARMIACVDSIYDI